MNLETLKEKFRASPMARAQYARNAKQLEELAEIAKRTGRNVRGKPESYWRAKANEFDRYSKQQ